MVFSTAVGAEEELVALKEMLAESVGVGSLKYAGEQLLLPFGECSEVVEEGKGWRLWWW